MFQTNFKSCEKKLVSIGIFYSFLSQYVFKKSFSTALEKANLIEKDNLITFSK